MLNRNLDPVDTPFVKIRISRSVQKDVYYRKSVGVRLNEDDPTGRASRKRSSRTTRSGRQPERTSGVSARDLIKFLTDVVETIKDHAKRESDKGSSPTAQRSWANNPGNDPTLATLSLCAGELAEINRSGRQIDWVAFDDSAAAILPVNHGEDRVALWRRVRSATKSTGCYPLLVDVDSLEYLYDPSGAPSRVGATDKRFSVLRAEYFAKSTPWPVADPIVGSFAHRSTEIRFGRTPTSDELARESFASNNDLDAFLFAWERSQFGDEHVISQRDSGYGQWYEPDSAETALVVLPLPDGPAAIRALSFYPTYDNPAWCDALGNDLDVWYRTYRAELIANYGTMLQFVVANPPEDLDTAYQLATEHDIVATATLPLPGIERRHYAADLIGRGRWHLHDRP